tara:strand:- start:1548 stop:1850 length:303 start_codon:yes stop_codon:yes gene_type:complete
MATYLEIRDLFNDSDLTNRVAVAVLVSVKDKLELNPTTAEKAYAAKVFANPKSEAKTVLMYVLAANNGATVAQIQGASDAAIQTNVDSVVDVLIDALAGV